MDIGMLWIDDGEKWAKPTSFRECEAFSMGTIDSQSEDYVKRARRTLASRVQEAAASYEAQYGLKPNLCLLNPSQVAGYEGELGGLRLEANPALLPNYFWIGRTAKSTVLQEKA